MLQNLLRQSGILVQTIGVIGDQLAPQSPTGSKPKAFRNERPAFPLMSNPIGRGFCTSEKLGLFRRPRLLCFAGTG